MPTAELVYNEGAKYSVKEPIRPGGAAFLIPGTDEVIPQTGDSNPTPVCVGHSSEELRPGDVVMAYKKGYDNGLKMIMLRRRVKVVAKDTNSPGSWFNKRMGEEFPVIKFYDDMIPKRFEVDLSAYKERGEVTVDLGWIPLACAQVVK